jgi:hypothetical protein
MEESKLIIQNTTAKAYNQSMVGPWTIFQSKSQKDSAMQTGDRQKIKQTGSETSMSKPITQLDNS